MARVAIIGGSGVIGREIVPKLLNKGYSLNLLSPTKKISTDQKVNCFSGDILSKSSILPGLSGCDVVINLATAIPKAGQTWDLNHEIRRKGTINVIEACIELGIRRYIQQSIAMIYKTTADEWADESSPFCPNYITESAVDMENYIKTSTLDWLILRGGLLYGPGTGRDETWRNQARNGELVLPKNKNDFVSLIHVSDFAESFSLALKNNVSRLALNIVDDEPVTYQTLYNFIAKSEGVAHLNQSETNAPFAFRVKNELAKTCLNWSPLFTNYKKGLAIIR